jgi:hypothetical protein
VAGVSLRVQSRTESLSWDFTGGSKVPKRCPPLRCSATVYNAARRTGCWHFTRALKCYQSNIADVNKVRRSGTVVRRLYKFFHRVDRSSPIHLIAQNVFAGRVIGVDIH